MSHKILTVDDSKTIRMIVRKAFRPYDCQVFEAENGVDGLSVAGKEKPDLIILDITMPVMNGIEMLEKLKTVPELKNTPVIMLTAESGKENVVHIVKLGVKDYVVKPFKDVQLMEKVKKVIHIQPKAADGDDGAEQTRYFTLDGDLQLLTLPEKVGRPAVVEIESHLPPTIEVMQKEERNKLIVDLSRVGEVNVSLVKLLVSLMQKCQHARLRVKVVGGESLAGKLKGFQETSQIQLQTTVAEARAAF
jgi:DNA-binding response OmpR family regulator